MSSYTPRCKDNRALPAIAHLWQPAAMLAVSIIFGALLGLIVQAGRSGFIPAWGEAEAPAWLQLVVICQALAIAYGYAGSSRGFLIIGLCGLGAYTLARAVLAALVEVVAAVRH